MNFEAVPIIRLEIDHMKQSILSALGVRGSELGEVLGKEIDKALANYPFEEHVSSIVNEAITRQIKFYFEYGDGRKAIEASVSDIFNKSGDE